MESATQKLPQPPDGVIDLDTAVDHMIAATNDEAKQMILTKDEKYLVGSYHMAGGMGLRNSWCLWWHEGADAIKDGHWPKEKPALIQWFNDRGIVHADDISTIIIVSCIRKVKGQPIDFDGQTKTYFDHWAEQGFKDGIFSYNERPRHK
jgi:hypothetical protein